MKKLLLTCISLFALIGSAVQADTLALSDGSLLEGSFIGSSDGIIMFRMGDSVEAFQIDQVMGLFFSSGVATANAKRAEEDATVTLPAGTRLLIRTSDNVDSRRHSLGHTFRGQLEEALVVDGITVALRGTLLHGRITQPSISGTTNVSSPLTMVFTDIMIGEQLLEIQTFDLKLLVRNDAEADNTARSSVLRLFSGTPAVRTGIALGTGGPPVVTGTRINVRAGSILETSLTEPLTLPRK